MSLGSIGQYGSDSNSSISDSCDEDDSEKRESHEASVRDNSGSPPSTACKDPLSLFMEDPEDSNDSNSETDSPTHESSLPAPIPLPLPDIDKMVARNASYSSSELVTKSATEGHQGDVVEKDSGESSVFFNPYKRAEESRLAILKQHVSEFDKKPDVRESESCGRNRGSFRSNNNAERGRQGFSRSRIEIPPPASYAKQVNSSASGGVMVPVAASVVVPVAQTHAGVVVPVAHTHAHNVIPVAQAHASEQVVARTAHIGVSSHGYHEMHHQETEEMLQGSDLFDEKDGSNLVKKQRKHRSGVGDSLLPPKKFMKMHEKMQAKERPWTLHKRQ